MRILALLSKNSFRLTLGWALEALGHRVHYLDTLLEDLLTEAIDGFAPDLFFDAGWDVQHGYPDRVAMLGRVLHERGLYHLYFAEEDSLHFETFSKPYVEKVKPQFVLTRAPACVAAYRAMGMGSATLDVGCNPGFHRPLPPDRRYLCDVAVVAHPRLFFDIYRRASIRELVVPLLHMGVHVALWGEGWDQLTAYFGSPLPPGVWRGPVAYTATPAIYSSAKINVSVQSQRDQVSSRTYDILAAGGFLLTSDTPGVRARLEPGADCAVSASGRATQEMVRHYLSRRGEREEIGAAGRRKAVAALAYQKTLPDALREVARDLGKKGGPFHGSLSAH